MIEIIPNWHPIWVHFAVGLLGGGTLFYGLAVVLGRADAGRRALIAARWALGSGVGFAAMALVTGFWAAGSVPHDAPAHANMMVHRNWAIASLVLFGVAALWMFLRRRAAGSSAGVTVVVMAGLVALAVTGYEGGQNVFEHGLGVQRLPDATAHDHAAHAAGGGHDDATDRQSVHDHDHDHGEAAHVEDGDAERADAGHTHGGQDHGHESVSPTEGPTIDGGELAMMAQALGDALAGGEVAQVRELMAEDVLIFESGGAERSLDEYAGHHMPADMKFLAAVDREVLERRVFRGAEVGVVASRSRLSGNYEDREINLLSSETLTLERRDGRWKIVQIHWASSPLTSDE